MLRRLGLALAAGLFGLFGLWLWVGDVTPVGAENPALNRMYYYPYYYFPHNYWPTQGPKWPEPVGAAYMPPPAYMAYPPFREPNWRYDAFEAHHYHRGSHFWLDQF